MTTKHLFLAGFAVLLFSCSDDPENTFTPPSNQDAVIDYYTVESTNTFNNAANSYSSFTTANLVDEKFFSETSEEFLDGVGQGQSTVQHYFYENGLLIKRQYDQDVRNFFYDGQGKLVGLTWALGNGPMAYYRFVHVTADKVFFEKVTLPYDDPQTAVVNRIVIEFDENDNVIKAGRDADNDGVANWYHEFEYDAANNLTRVQEYGGPAIDISYASIKDNFAKLAINTYGKRNLMIYQAECYANLTVEEMRHSPDLRMTDTQDALIEIQALPYYFRKTKTTSSADGSNTVVTTFYFE